MIVKILLCDRSKQTRAEPGVAIDTERAALRTVECAIARRPGVVAEHPQRNHGVSCTTQSVEGIRSQASRGNSPPWGECGAAGGGGYKTPFSFCSLNLSFSRLIPHREQLNRQNSGRLEVKNNFRLNCVLILYIRNPPTQKLEIFTSSRRA